MTNDSLLEQAIIALDKDDAATAQALLARLLQAEPRNERAWLLMAEAQSEPERKRFCIEKALAINPNNLMALQMRDELNPPAEAQAPPPQPTSPATSEPVFEPQPQASNLWPEPVPPARISTESDPAFIRRELERAVDLIESGNRTGGMDILEQILAVDPNNESALLGMAAATRSLDERGEYLMRVLSLNPRNKAARKLLAEAQQQPQLKASKYAVTDAVEAAVDVKEYDWVEAWALALTRPTSGTYAGLLSDPNAGALRALTWIITASLFGTYFFILMQAAVLLATGQSAPVNAPGLTTTPLAAIGIAALCVAPLSALGNVINLSVSAAVFNLAGRVLGGRGTFGGQLYAIAAYTAPLLILGFVASTFAYLIFTFSQTIAFTLVLYCLGIPLGLYTLYLNVLAIKAAQGFGWLRAIVAFLLPALAGIAVGACLVFVIAQSLGPDVLRNLQELQRNLPAP
jgi:thioredoxin-like negative regulator of GroEL